MYMLRFDGLFPKLVTLANEAAAAGPAVASTTAVAAGTTAAARSAVNNRRIGFVPFRRSRPGHLRGQEDDHQRSALLDNVPLSAGPRGSVAREPMGDLR